MNNTCGCCEGIEQLTPTPTINRPGLSAIAYRVGTHGSFLETMQARLSNFYLEVPSPNDSSKTQKLYPLLGLKTRLSSDPAIAFLDAWAIVADVLTFYQERIANEGYLRTATERRSILELARLVGYELRPGVAASVYLAYTLENNQNVEIVAGNRAQSLPEPGELPQSFETSQKLIAKSAWNNLKPRLTRPQKLSLATDKLYLQGVATNLKPNDPLLFVSSNEQVLRRVRNVEVQSAENRTRIISQDTSTQAVASTSISVPSHKKLPQLDDLTAPLTKPPSRQPANELRLQRNITKAFSNKSDNNFQILTTFQPQLSSTLYAAWRNLPVTEPSEVKVYALRTRASVFGHNAPPRRISSQNRGEPPTDEEWTLEKISTTAVPENFEIEVELSPIVSMPTPPRAMGSLALTGWFMRTKITIAGQQINDPPSENPRQLTQDTTFTIDHPAVRETITVTYSIAANNRLTPFNLEFQFSQRPLVVKMGIDGENHYSVSSAGSDPSAVTITKTSAEPPPVINPTLGQVQTRFNLTASGRVKSHSVATEEEKVVWLDAPYEQILPGSWVVVERPDKRIIAQVTDVSNRSRYEYGVSFKSTRLELSEPWINPAEDNFTVIRETAVFAQNEELELVEEPILEPIGSQTKNGAEIELGDLYDGLEAGRWIVVSGDRADLPGNIGGVKASELVMLAGVEQSYDPDLPGDKTHTILQLANSLAYSYNRDTVTIYGNVVKATHGETRTEVLGSGDGSQSLQSFTLQSLPLTYLSVPTAAGAASTLEIRVNDIRWHETESLAELKPQDRNFITLTDDEGKTTVIFGNGEQGARPPSGIENIKAVYRTGIGKRGNVKAEQVSLLATRPLGVRSVINPLPATGGADPESRDQARRNAPLAVMALDRLVSVQDYIDFARTFAGIGKASATRLWDGQQQIVHLTIAGADDIPIDENSDLYRNFVQALRQSGAPNQPLLVEKRELLLLIINANLQILPDYQWESVATKVRTALLETFSFQKRELGQNVFLSEVISAIANTPGIAYVDVDTFGAIPEKTTDLEAGKRRVLTPTEIKEEIQKLIKQKNPSRTVEVSLATSDKGVTQPAQLAYLTPLVPDTLFLNQILS
ncbi:putative baseplate assembly protein [Iningainema tapete]|uniref:Putative baseplate assembly protein n=1 Tax=Iningainema tapete BLCC-T55 TaxID=2748662 RepID=A0A8J6XJ33_9CYAN|nr:putative baseplate assembly protein [Iningainema tapete]MBD2773366.1 putative baseplate assembly protein [Iningainema tapete BLCC-T55]